MVELNNGPPLHLHIQEGGGGCVTVVVECCGTGVTNSSAEKYIDFNLTWQPSVPGTPPAHTTCLPGSHLYLPPHQHTTCLLGSHLYLPPHQHTTCLPGSHLYLPPHQYTPSVYMAAIFTCHPTSTHHLFTWQPSAPASPPAHTMPSVA